MLLLNSFSPSSILSCCARPLGSLTTPYHSLQLGVRSLLDSVDVIPGKGPMADDVSRWDTTFITGDDNKSATRRAKKEEDGSQRMITGTGEPIKETPLQRALHV